jgi:hypothetical protein
MNPIETRTGSEILLMRSWSMMVELKSQPFFLQVKPIYPPLRIIKLCGSSMC